MTAKQLSVFIENRQGRLKEVLAVLKENEVNILSLSLADTTEYGLLRLIVGDPETGREKLAAAGFSTVLTDVLILEVPHRSGALQEILAIVSESGVSVEYMYGLSVGGEQASIVVKTSDSAKACEVFEKNGIRTLSGEDIAKLQ